MIKTIINMFTAPPKPQQALVPMTPGAPEPEVVTLERITNNSCVTTVRRSPPYDPYGMYKGNPADLIQQSAAGYNGQTSDYGYVGTHSEPSVCTAVMAKG